MSASPPPPEQRTADEIYKELESTQNQLSSLRLEASSPGPALTTKKRTKLKTLAQREKELEVELRKAKRAGELQTLGDDLRKAATKNDLDKVKEICTMPDAKRCVDSTNFEGTTSLIKAAIYDRLEMVNLLAEAGAQLDHVDDLGRTALMLAAGNGALSVVDRLVELGATASLQALNGWTALMFAAEGGHLEVAQFFLEGVVPIVPGHALTLKTKAGKTILDLVNESKSKGTAAVAVYLKPLVEAAAKGAPTEGWSQLRRLSRVSMAASAFQSDDREERRESQPKPQGFFARMLGGEGHRGLGAWLRGVAHDIGESFRTSFRDSRSSFSKSFSKGRNSRSSRTRTSKGEAASMREDSQMSVLAAASKVDLASLEA